MTDSSPPNQQARQLSVTAFFVVLFCLTGALYGVYRQQPPAKASLPVTTLDADSQVHTYMTEQELRDTKLVWSGYKVGAPWWLTVMFGRDQQRFMPAGTVLTSTHEPTVVKSGNVWIIRFKP